MSHKLDRTKDGVRKRTETLSLRNRSCRYPAVGQSCFASSSCSFCFCELDRDRSRMCMKCKSFNVCERCAKTAPDFMTWHRTECEWLENWRRDASEEMMTLPTEYLVSISFRSAKAGSTEGIFDEISVR